MPSNKKAPVRKFSKQQVEDMMSRWESLLDDDDLCYEIVGKAMRTSPCPKNSKPYSLNLGGRKGRVSKLPAKPVPVLTHQPSLEATERAKASLSTGERSTVAPRIQMIIIRRGKEVTVWR